MTVKSRPVLRSSKQLEFKMFGANDNRHCQIVQPSARSAKWATLQTPNHALNFFLAYVNLNLMAQLVNLVVFVLWSISMRNLLQAIPQQPCHILSLFCSLYYTTNWALEFHPIYLFIGWHLWKLGWPLPIMCVQAISQELTARKISWDSTVPRVI
jgi:hypothetical protein